MSSKVKQEAMDVDDGYNPLTPEADERKLYEWQIVPAMGAGDAMAKMIQNLRDDGFQYASTIAPPGVGGAEMALRDRGGVHLYRLRKDKNYEELEERRIAQQVLEFQQHILDLRIKQDEKAVELAEYRKAHPDMGWK